LLSNKEIAMRPFSCLRRRHAAAVFAAVAALAILGASTQMTSAVPLQVPKKPPPPPPPPVTAKSYLQELVNWCKLSKPGWSPNYLHLVMVSNCPDKNQDASYTEGDLALVGSTHLQTAMTHGEMSDTHYYNNKRWSKQGSFTTYPFDPTGADHPKLALDAATGKATVPSVASPGSLVTIDLEYAHGVLYGQYSGTGEMFVITLKKVPGQQPPK
jgi:hypothetical protein